MMIAITCVDSYSGPSQAIDRSFCRYRRGFSWGSYSIWSHRNALKILVDVLGTITNVSTKVAGRMRSNPAFTVATVPRGATSAESYFQRSRPSSQLTQQQAEVARSAMGQHEPINKRLRYDPKQAAGMTRFSKSAGNSMTSIHLVYSSKPGGGLTSNTLGMAETHW
eukprot:6167397-Prymnesium_polylepis.3